jgi:anti-sigma B factor antagonist
MLKAVSDTTHTSEPFRVAEEDRGDGVVIVAVGGDADLHVAPELRERLTATIDGGAQELVLDLSETTFLDSMALGVMLGAMKRLRARGGHLRLVVTRPDIRRIFEITLLDRAFPLHGDRQAALAAAQARDGDGGTG